MQGEELRDLLSYAERPDVISFAGGLPGAETFPAERMKELVDYVLTERPREALQYGTTEGYSRLREAIARHMQEVHGVTVSPPGILVTQGSQQALSVLSHILLDPGDVVVTGAPSYLGALQAFAAYEARIESVPLDEDGIRTDLLAERLEALAREGCRPKLIYLAATFQNPSGATISWERRRHVYELACAHDLLVIEDDAYGRLRYDGEPVPAIKTLDEEGRVIYMCSFSKILVPGFRTAWIAGPEPVIAKAIMAKQSQDLCSNTFAQHCICEAMERGLLLPHIETVIPIYRRKRDTMLAAAEKHLPDGVRWNRPEGGLFVWAVLPPSVNTQAMLPKAIASKVAYVPGHAFFPDGSGYNTMRLNFSFPAEDVLEEGIRRLGRVMAQEIEQRQHAGPADAS